MKSSFLSWVLTSKKRCKVSLTYKHKHKHILTFAWLLNCFVDYEFQALSSEVKGGGMDAIINWVTILIFI